ncbi:hypothetical protein CAPTEDRAFT_204792 [Capitella teleta]|uniref:Uncharacterized protein n=1 Tax=Capitella teleta TaxID=283909 RepID=R7UR00_CAPTE|nr:hypothetical protein CAPTEDRAFT_204792 [Capitella teleta]|eukprot:ELU08538.1 hypothetical protein CAPTEDRAFT_204792 [Capitella teleta]
MRCGTCCTCSPRLSTIHRSLVHFRRSKRCSWATRLRCHMISSTTICTLLCLKHYKMSESYFLEDAASLATTPQSAASTDGTQHAREWRCLWASVKAACLSSALAFACLGILCTSGDNSRSSLTPLVEIKCGRNQLSEYVIPLDRQFPRDKLNRGKLLGERRG